MSRNSRGYDIVDTHVHIFDLDFRDHGMPNRNFTHGWPNDEDVPQINRTILMPEAEEEAEEAGVNNLVFMQCFQDSPEESLWVHACAQNSTYGKFKGIVAGLDLTQHEKLQTFVSVFKRDLKKPKFVGVRMVLEPAEHEFFESEDFHKGLGILENNDLTFDLLLRPELMKHVPVLASKFPRLRMVINHLAKPTKYGCSLEEWKSLVDAISPHPNVYMKLSGLLNEPYTDSKGRAYATFRPFIHHVVESFGVNRCMFGSDWPVCRTGTQGPKKYLDVVEFVEKLLDDLPLLAKKKIFQENAVEFYQLQDVVDTGNQT